MGLQCVLHCCLYQRKEKLSGENSDPKLIGKIHKEQLYNRRHESTKAIPQLVITGLSMQQKTIFRKGEYWFKHNRQWNILCRWYLTTTTKFFQLYSLNFNNKPCTLLLYLLCSFEWVMPFKLSWKVSLGSLNQLDQDCCLKLLLFKTVAKNFPLQS